MKRPDPVEIVAVTVPVLIEAVCVVVFIACSATLIAIFSTPMVPA